MLPQNHEISIWFDEEVKVNEPALRAYLKNRTPAAGDIDVDDIVQESYVRILKAKNFNSVDSPRGLLFSIAKNITRDLFRKKNVSKTISLGGNEALDVLSIVESKVEGEYAQKDEVEILQTAIRMLPEKCRIIFLLRNYENLSYKEIAKKLNLSTKTVETQLAIGIKKCRKHFEAYGLIGAGKTG